MKFNFFSDFKQTFLKVVSSKNLTFSFKNLAYLPRWIILLLDLSLVLVSTYVTFTLFKTLSWNFISSENLYVGIFFQFSTNIFFFWLFRTYSGIIRHSSYIDGLKLFFSQFSTFFVIVALNLGFVFFGFQKIYLTTASFFNAILSFSLLFFYRIIVKQTFEYFFNENSGNPQIKVIIYGNDANAIAVANAIKSETPQRFKLLGFIDKSNQNSFKRILNLPIYQVRKSVPILMRSIAAEAIIIADKSLSKDDRLAIVEDCIEYNFKVYRLPIISDWENENEIVKNIKNFEIQDLLERKAIVLDTQAIASKLNGKTILVTGAAGSIGSEIVRQLLSFSPKTILLLDQAETPLHNLTLEILAHNATIEIKNIIADIKDKALVETIFKNNLPNVVYHAAAYKHVPLMEENPNQAVLTNVLGTKIIADLSEKYNVERFVMISTDKAVNPSSIMGASKRIAEMYIQSKHFSILKNNLAVQTKFITTRFGNVLGSNGSVVPLFSNQIQRGGPITITHPDIIRYFMTIPEACQLVLEACSMGNGGEIFIFDMGKPVKIIDLAKKMIRLAGFKPDIDIKIKIIGLRPGEKLYEELLNDSAKNLPTHHNKILIAEENCPNFEYINVQIVALIQTSISNKNIEIVTLMKKLVPEFRSLNSVYESLDQ